MTAAVEPVDPELQRRLLDWYQARARTLPWRRTRDPYRILVSEVMLQQTQAARVAPAYTAFLDAFPTVTGLAAAAPGEVVRRWRGLGYNRRAIALQRAARVIVDEHGGRVPDDLAALRALPGVGDYTARAVLAFAFGRDVAPVDTNVARVLSRAVVGAPLSRREAQQVADRVLPPGRAAAWTSALMDLGATVCTARRIDCPRCPLAARCAWRRRGDTADPAAIGALRPRPQAPFADSDRAYRGRLVDALRRGRLRREELAAAAGLEDRSRLEAVVASLVRDGLAVWDDHEAVLRLP